MSNTGAALMPRFRNLLEDWDMKLFPTFAEYVAAREEVIWASPPLKGIPRINTTPFTNAHRKRMRVKSKPAVHPFAPTIRAVAQVVPQHLIPKFKSGK
jgi:hypothetical protein